MGHFGKMKFQKQGNLQNFVFGTGIMLKKIHLAGLCQVNIPAWNGCPKTKHSLSANQNIDKSLINDLITMAKMLLVAFLA